MNVSTVNNEKVLRGASTAFWGEVGGFRLHNGKDVCRLESDSKYIVSMQIMVKSGTATTTGIPANATSEIKLGYGAAFNASMSGNGTNYVNKMNVELKTVMSSVIDSDSYTLDTGFGKTKLEYSEEWHTVTYQINTPADFGTNDNVITIWMRKYNGVEVLIDDVAVTKLADNYHIYSCYWDDSCLKFSFDGKKFLDYQYEDNLSVAVHCLMNYFNTECHMGDTSYGVVYDKDVHEDYYEHKLDYVRIYQSDLYNCQLITAWPEKQETGTSKIFYPDHDINGAY